MSQALIHALFEAIDGGNWDALDGLLHDDVVYDRPGYTPFAGRGDVMHFYRHLRIISTGEHRLEQIVADDLHGATWGLFVGVAKDGRPLAERFADVYEFCDGRIRRRQSYFFRPAI